MKCPSCGCPLEVSADGTRGYCKVKICNAMVKLDDKLYGMGEGNNANNQTFQQRAIDNKIIHNV